MLKQLLYLLLTISIASNAANGLDPHPTPIHHVPKRLRQTRLFAPSERSNDPLLPNDYYGSPLGPKASGHMRLLLNNPNRISAQNDFVDFQYICQRMLAYDVDIFGLSETGVNWKLGYAWNRCKQILQDFWPHSRLIGSTSDIPSKEVVQYGGTCTVVTDKWTGRIESSGSDPQGLGRWSYVRLNGKNGRRVTIVTVYQVCKQTVERAGPKTAFMQQWHLLRRAGTKDPNPRQSFCKDLDAFLTPLQAAGDELLVMGDLNEHLGHNTSGMNAVAAKFGLVDSTSYHHGIEGELATYSRSNNRLDYILCTHGIATSIWRCGVLPFNFVISSDHRAVFIDVDIDEFLGGDPSPLMSLALRGIRSQNPKACVKYVTEMEKYMAEHHVYARVATLSELTDTHGLTALLKKRWDGVDQDILRASLHAEKSVAKRHKPPWSQALHQAALRATYWRIALSGKRTARDVTAVLEALYQVIDWAPKQPPPPNMSVPDIQAQLRHDQAELKKIRKDASSLRSDMLQERAAAEALAGNDEEATILRRLERAEATKACFGLLRKYLKPSSSGGLTKVQVADGVDANGTEIFKDVSESEEMFQLILERNFKHFGQANGTPFTEAPLKDWLGKYGETETGQAIINGDLRPTLDTGFPETQTVLDLLQPFDPPAEPVSPLVTSGDFKSFFAKWKENTSTSPSGKHLGHYKALLSPALVDNDDLTAAANRIIDVHVALLNIAAQHGSPMERWKRIVSVMIEKKAGNYQLNKLRTIHLFEADYNWLLGMIFGRRMVHGAEKQNHLHEGQWGSRPGRSAHDALLHKILTYEIARLTRTPLATFDNDAKSCYDRIVMSFALMLCQKHGVPQSMCMMAAMSLLAAEYSIKTKYGVSTGTYSSTDDHPTHGPGQGSRMAPALWLIICCLLFDAMTTLCHGAEFCNPSQTVSHKRIGDGFVDDVTNFRNFGLAAMLAHDYGPVELASALQQEAQTWERLLYSTGGQLELTKCLYYLMIFDSKPDGTPTLRKAADMGTDLISMTTGKSATTTEIEHRDCSKAHRTLGLHPAPTGCQLTQAQELRTKSDRFAEGMAKAPLSQYEARTAYWMMWLPSMTYCLPCSYMTKNQLHHVQKKMTSTSLSKRGYSSKTSRAVVFGPRRFLGIGDRHLYYEQGIGATLQLVKHIRSGSNLGTFLQIGLDWTQLHAGVSFSILENTITALPHLEHGWFPMIRKFLGSTNASIHVSTTVLPRLLRANDCILMDDLLKNDLFKTSAVKKIALCRLFLQVDSLAEICNPTGDCILPSVWKGERPVSKSRTLWPRQVRPHEASWRIWRRFLKFVYLHPDKQKANKRSDDLRLEQPLGPWIGDRHLEVRRWRTYLSTDGDSLYHYRPEGLHRSSRADSRERHTHHFPRRSVPVQTLPTGVIPVQVQLASTIAILRPVPYPAQIPDPCLPPVAPPPTDFFDMITNLPHWQSSILAHLESALPVNRLKQLLESGEKLHLYLVSDGGAKDDLGSFGWELAVGRTILWNCMGPTFGLQPGSFRAESYGMLSVMLFLDHYFRFFQVEVSDNVDHLFYCDNQGLLKRIGYAMDPSWDNPNHCLSAEYDLESGIVDVLHRLPVKFSYNHVKGHQDEEMDVEDLPWEAQMNCHADAYATDYLENWSEPSKIVPFIPASNASIAIDGVTVTSHLARRLRQAASSPALEEHIMLKNGWNDWIFNSIDWDVQAKALNTLEYTQELFVTKLAHDLLPTRRHMHRIGKAESDLCPSCLETIETAPHIFACERRVTWQVTFLDSLRKLLAKLHTQPDLQMILMVGLDGALQDDPLFDMPTDHREASFELLVSSQNDIGWSHLLRGRFSHHWVQIQQHHIDHDDEISSKKFTGQRWLQKVLNHIWTHLYMAWKLRNADLHGIDAADQEAKRQAKLKPAIVALYETAATLPYLDKRLFELPLIDRLDLKSHEQTAWINVTTPTVRQAKTEADDKLHTTQRDIRKYLFRKAAVPVGAPRGPLAEQAQPPAEQAQLPAEQARPPAEQAHARHPIPRLRDG
jgi:hypothetical protein